MVKFSIQKSYKVLMLTPAIFGIGILAMGSPARADEVSELKAQLKALQQRIEALEKRPVETQIVTVPADKVAVPAKPVQKGYFVIPGTETSLRIGGYTKLDAIYSDKSAGDNNTADQLFLPYAIPLDKNNPDDNQVVLHARQSRFNVGTSTDTAYGKLNTFFEGDFFGGANVNPASGNGSSSNADFRIRHAYGELGKLLAGQTWTTFEVMDSLPDTVDFGGPAAQTFMRQGLIRWTEPFAWGSLQFAVEDPNATFDNSTETDDDHVADLVARLNYKSEYGSYSVAAMARELSIDRQPVAATTATPYALATREVTSVDDSTWGGALTFGGRIPAYGKDDLRFQFNYGNALGRYMTTKFRDATFNTRTNEIETFDQYGGFLAYRHFWVDNLRSSLVYSYGAADNDVAISGTSVDKEMQSVHVNLIWNIVPSVELGIEYLHGYREVESGADGELNRIQLSAQYNFF
jgi:hypothetical protein